PRFEEREVKDIAELQQYSHAPTFTWINVDGIHQVEIIETIGKFFGVHSLILEDILNTNQRPKIEDHGEYVYIVWKILSYNDATEKIDSEQISIILGSNFIISFLERECAIFDPLKDRLRTNKGHIRKNGVDYLTYSLLDAVVDYYFAILEKLGDRLALLEEELVRAPDKQTLQKILSMKREVLFLRKSIWPLREVINSMEKGGSAIFRKETLIYLRDVYDHTVQIMDTVETFRDVISGMLDIYLSSVSNKLNQIMKILTIITTIFIPLSFIAGIYGMNFRNMPELEWEWGYFSVLIFMGIISLVMIYYFRKKRWI
ncbi:MAG: magnesium/cobalt transporter CorA, partial [Deltaproteobacteria bacterium]|nr:magnesium/cobalt transporter CorA [Deltaproteobacteria bacterium]